MVRVGVRLLPKQPIWTLLSLLKSSPQKGHVRELSSFVARPLSCIPTPTSTWGFPGFFSRSLFSQPTHCNNCSSHLPFVFFCSLPGDSNEKAKAVTKPSSNWTIPNLLSGARLLAAPYVSYLIITDNFPTASAIFLVAAATDFIDGYIARKYNQKSIVGTWLDPCADKSMMLLVSLSLAYTGLLPLSLVGLIIVRDFTLFQGAMWYRFISLPLPKTFRSFLEFGNTVPVEVTASTLSKVNTVLQMSLVSLLLLSGVPIPSLGEPFALFSSNLTEFVIPLSCTTVAFTTWLSGVQYWFQNPFQKIQPVGISQQAMRYWKCFNASLIFIGFSLFASTCIGSYYAFISMLTT